jgi:BlaI family transcriptional regulator, penicillinase repressor
MTTRRNAKLLTPQELEIMKVVWDAPEVTVRYVYEVLRRRRTLAYTTVMTLMQILERKGHLKKSAAARQHVYRAARTRRHTVSALLRDFVDRVFNGSTKPLLVQLAEDGRLSKEDVEELKALLEESK